MVLACGAAMAQQVLYKWNDAQGKTYYGDHPPKAALNVTRVELDVPATNVVPPVAPKATGEDAKEAVKAPADVATQRRDLRNRLETNLIQARAKLETAKRALAEVQPAEDEGQYVQQRRPLGPGGGTGAGTTSEGQQVGGMLGMAPRVNCREVEGRGGKRVVVCPSFVANEKYADRVALLEEAVRKAEEEVAEAEYAYRRGVD